MVEWTGYANRLHVGMDWAFTKYPSQGDPSVSVAVNAYAQTNYTYYDYDGTVTITGDFGSGQQTRRMSNSNVMTFHSWTAGFTARYNETYNVRLNLRAEGTGAGPVDGSWWLTIPRRPTGNSTPPRNARVQSLTWDTAEITWDPPSDYRGADWNRYEVALDNGSWVPSNNWRTHKFTGLKGGTTYKFWVRAVCQGWDAWRNGEALTFNFTTPQAVPNTPAAPAISAVTTTTAQVKMGTPTTPGLPVIDTGAWVYDAASGGALVWTDGVPDLATQWIATGLPRATDLWAEVAAKNDAGWSSRSPRTKFTTLPDLPGAPSGYSLRDVTANTAYTTGQMLAVNGGEAPTDLEVQWGSAPDADTAASRRMGAWTDAFLDDMTAGVTYFYRLRAGNRAGFGAWSAWQQFTTNAYVPNRTEAPRIDWLEIPSVILSWPEAVPNIAEVTGYQLQVSSSKSFSTLFYESYTDRLNALVTGIQDGTQYFARVRPNSAAGPGAWSPTSQVPVPDIGSGAKMWLRVAGAWKLGTLWFNVGGTWRHAVLGIRADGDWRSS